MGMNRRCKGNRKPMSDETKLARRKVSEADRARTKADLIKKSKK